MGMIEERGEGKRSIFQASVRAIALKNIISGLKHEGDTQHKLCGNKLSVGHTQIIYLETLVRGYYEFHEK